MKAAAFRTVTGPSSDLHMACGKTKHLYLTGAWFDQAKEQLKRCGFSCSICSQQCEYLARADLQVQILQCRDFPVFFTKSLGDQHLCLLCFHDPIDTGVSVLFEKIWQSMANCSFEANKWVSMSFADFVGGLHHEYQIAKVAA